MTTVGVLPYRAGSALPYPARVFALSDNPVLLLVALGIPLAVGALVLFGLYWVVRLAVRHGATDADRRARGALPGPPTP